MDSQPQAGSRTQDYDYELPEELIAQYPCKPRDASRLLTLNRNSGNVSHKKFPDIVDLLNPGDALIMNITRVFRARLTGNRESGMPAEVFLLRPVSASEPFEPLNITTAGTAGILNESCWEALVHPGAKLKPGRRVNISSGLWVEILAVTELHSRIVKLHIDPAIHTSVSEALSANGHVPLPPYIDRPDSASDEELYQTVYAEHAGSVAAPTAGLHFTPEILTRIRGKGVKTASVVLHVGAGTFRPVQHDDPSLHIMHEEWFDIPESTAELIKSVRDSGKRVWATGTTVARTLESAANNNRTVNSGSGVTSLFLRPPQKLQVVDCLITNFHQPKSTLLMLVAAFAGYENMTRAYQSAVEERYRFFSYGDAMCII